MIDLLLGPCTSVVQLQVIAGAVLHVIY